MERYSDIAAEELAALLNELHDRYNRVEFIEDDPISIPHSFQHNADREIAGFLAATIAWGNRKAILKSARRMVAMMDYAPYDFTMNASAEDLRPLKSFVHRTFSGEDFVDFIRAMQRICHRYGTIGNMFESLYEQSGSVTGMLSMVRREFFDVEHSLHCEKHLSSIDKGAACKRLNMYLRWFVRRDSRGVDFGTWQRIPMRELYLPLDVHSANMGRALELLQRRQNDWKAVAEITSRLAQFDAEDPVRYDFALFGAGIDGFLK